jgi:hypothetical protein
VPVCGRAAGAAGVRQADAWDTTDANLGQVRTCKGGWVVRVHGVLHCRPCLADAWTQRSQALGG